jgi:hypothetical protein
VKHPPGPPMTLGNMRDQARQNSATLSLSWVIGGTNHVEAAIPDRLHRRGKF